MAQRVTEAEVKALVGTSLSEEAISPYLCSASSVCDNHLAGLGYGGDDLRHIELWLAAHFVAVRDRTVAREKIGPADVQYDGKTAMGLDFTPFGQQVKLLEYKGKLASIEKSKGPAELKVVG